jgi:hypothetical protein
VPASKKLLADLLRITPILYTNPDGSISTNRVLPGRRNLLPKFARLIARESNRNADLRISIGHALCAADADQLAAHLRDRLPNTVKISITELGSAIGVHGGPGTIVVGVQEYRPPEEFRQ